MSNLKLKAGAILVSAAFATGDTRADDPAATAQCFRQAPPPKILFENERVTVKEVTMQPGEGNFLHDHKVPHVAIVIDEGVLVDSPYARKEPKLLKSGEMVYVSRPIRHEGFNAGNTVFRYILIDLKDKPGAAAPDKVSSAAPVASPAAHGHSH